MTDIVFASGGLWGVHELIEAGQAGVGVEVRGPKGGLREYYWMRPEKAREVAVALLQEADRADGGGECPNCGHDGHYAKRCAGKTDEGQKCACSWPDPFNFPEVN